MPSAARTDVAMDSVQVAVSALDVVFVEKTPGGGPDIAGKSLLEGDLKAA